ncbi:MAG: HTTM domain-containing protein [Cyanobacteria bacterium SZAS-4]|nr:HTTM domain-containing protein [Cyanobacteria bacterium SZAS-4]
MIDSIPKFWNQLWFDQVSPAPVCLFRILFGLLVLISNIIWAPELLNYFGPNGLVSVATIEQFEHGPRFSLLFLQPNSEPFVIAIYAILLLSSLTVTIGLFTRPSLIILFVCLISFHHRNVAILHSGDTLLRLFTFLLIFSSAGKMFSFDNRTTSLTDQWKIRSDCWPQRLLQLQLAAVYCATFMARTVGQTWWDGTAVYYASRLEAFQRFPMPYVFDHLWTCQFLTYTTLLVELALFTLVWFKKTRYIALCAGILMHLCIDWTMNIPLFEYTMIIGFINFVEASDIKKFCQALKFGSAYQPAPR